MAVFITLIILMGAPYLKGKILHPCADTVEVDKLDGVWCFDVKEVHCYKNKRKRITGFVMT